MTSPFFNILISADIDAATIEKIVLAAIEKETGRKVKTLTFNIAQKDIAGGRDYTYALSGAKVTFGDPVPSPVRTSLSASQWDDGGPSFYDK